MMESGEGMSLDLVNKRSAVLEIYFPKQGEQLAVEFEKERKVEGAGRIKVFYQVLSVGEQGGMRGL